MKTIKVIKFYRKNSYGNELRYIHPDNKADADIVQRLTGKKTIDSVTMELLRDLAGGTISFQEVIAP
jgi:hypothetical protein